MENPEDYKDFALGGRLVIENAREQIKGDVILVKDPATGKEYRTIGNFTQLEIAMLLAGGKINMIKGQK